MSNLSFVELTDVEDFISELRNLRRGGNLDKQKPHKLIMLLAVIDLFNDNLIIENRVYFSTQLQRNFSRRFNDFSSENDWCQPGPPFFHLRTSSFWKLMPKPGREIVLENLKTTGGGIKRIQDNIEYAYFSEKTFKIFAKPESRKIIEVYIVSLLNQNNERLGTSFHETFSLSRESIKQVIEILSHESFDKDVVQEGIFTYLRKRTTLGTNYVKAMPKYARGTGLLTSSYQLTRFGKLVRNKDCSLAQRETQWLMHYYMSAPIGPGPSFWHDVVRNRFMTGNEFSTQDIADQIALIYQNNEGNVISDRTARQTAVIFLGTYTKPEGLENLGILENIDPDHYRVVHTDPPSHWVIGIALIHYWASKFKGLVSVNLNDIIGENSLASLFVMGSGEMNSKLRELQKIDYVQVSRSAPPYQLMLKNDDPQYLLENLYG